MFQLSMDAIFYVVDVCISSAIFTCYTHLRGLLSFTFIAELHIFIDIIAE